MNTTFPSMTAMMEYCAESFGKGDMYAADDMQRKTYGFVEFDKFTGDPTWALIGIDDFRKSCQYFTSRMDSAAARKKICVKLASASYRAEILHYIETCETCLVTSVMLA